MSISGTVQNGKYNYIPGFGNLVSTEAEAGALPLGKNTPQVCPMGLYAEQINGSAFTAPRIANYKTWMYRIRPSVQQKTRYESVNNGLLNCDFTNLRTNPNQMRWKPLPYPSEPTNWVEGLVTICGSGDPTMKAGTVVHLYACTANMVNTSFYNSDGDMLIVPQEGALDIFTELGHLEVNSGEICVIPRGIQFQVTLPEGKAKGYVCEVYGRHFVIPDLGPIGANGLANPRDFLNPVAAYRNEEVQWTVLTKFQNNLFKVLKGHCPFDVVAWHGNYTPYKYDLSLFCAVNSVTYDHMDPSIFTVLTCQTGEPGTAAADFVIFPPRWMVAEGTFRPPYYHRNCMSEYMGLIRGTYEAKKGGFVPGAGSLHSCMTPHGPDKQTFDKASTEEQVPFYHPKSALAFMFESTYMLAITKWAQVNLVDEDYIDCWKGFENNFKKT